ncbi:MAG: hypothetical protein M3083_11575 [Actinomycetota bacterium]|nr:hypothetical protein [Actinomycetota bacterium]
MPWDRVGESAIDHGVGGNGCGGSPSRSGGRPRHHNRRPDDPGDHWGDGGGGDHNPDPARGRHLPENVSFDHYFGTYPHAANTSGQPFWAEHHAPDINKGKFSTPPAPDQGLCNAVHPVGAAVGGTGGTAPDGTTYGSKDDYIAHLAPFQYYAAS